MILTKPTKASALALAVAATVALGFGLSGAPSSAAPASKPSNSTTDLTEALKTARPINIALLEQDEVLTEVKCTAEQRKVLADLFKSARAEWENAMRQPPMAVAGPGGGIVRIVGPGPVKFDVEKMTAALKPDQLLRVRQLELHLRGPQAFGDRRVARALALTAEQEFKLEEIIIKYEPEFTATMVAVRGRDQDVKPLAELGDKFTADCLKLLTKEQKATWDWLVGKRPEAGQWAQALMPLRGGNTAMAINGGAIRLLPVVPIAPPPVAPPPPKKDKE